MSGGITLASVASYAAIAGAALTVVSTISAAQDAKAAGKSQAAADRANAETLRNNAAQASREASNQEDILRARQRVIRGDQIAGIAESGIGFEGTGGDLVEQSDINASMDDLAVRYDGEMRARQLNTAADQSTFDAAVAENQGTRAGNSGYFSAVGAAAKGVTSYASWQSKYAPTGKDL